MTRETEIEARVHIALALESLDDPDSQVLAHLAEAALARMPPDERRRALRYLVDQFLMEIPKP